jgi:glycosyltransferase involved in cell wall biosynthesis
MKILIVNACHKITGGGDTYSMRLARAFQAFGHQPAFAAMGLADNLPAAGYPFFPLPCGLQSTTWKGASLAQKVRAYFNGIYNPGAKMAVQQAIRRFGPEVVHLQKIFYQLSPSVISAARECAVPVVQTLHDFQIICASNNLHARGRVCEECRGRRFHRILANKCYNDSWSNSWLAFSAKVAHSAAGLYPGELDRLVAPSQFLKQKVESFGIELPPIDHVPICFDPPKVEPDFEPGRHILYLGRLVRHKGVLTLLKAMQKVRTPLVLVGTGSELPAVRAEIERHGLTHVRALGFCSDEVAQEMTRTCRFLVVPSEWYENQPAVALEAFSCGKAVLAANIGGLPEIVRPGMGELFTAGQADELTEKLNALSSQPERLREMGRLAWSEGLEEFSPARHVERLLRVYQSARSAARAN